MDAVQRKGEGVLEAWSSLRLSREALGLTLVDAEKATRVRSRYLRALEEGRLDELPGGSYPRVFLRDYAVFLGLDPALLLEELPEPEPEISPQPVASPIRPLPWRAAAAAVLVLGVLAGGVVWAFAPHGRTTLKAAPTGASKVVRHATAVPTKASAAPRVAVLRAARGDCWILVRRGDRVVWQGMLREGRTLKLGLAHRLVVRLGAPWNVDARVAGRRLAPFAHRPLDVVLAA